MSERISPLAGKPAPHELLVNVPLLISAYYTGRPDPSVPAQRVAFGTSGHRGSSFDNAFNEWHVLAVTQAICDHRRQRGIDGPSWHAIPDQFLELGVGRQRLSRAGWCNDCCGRSERDGE